MNIIIYTLVILTILYFLLKFITKISSKKISKGLRILLILGFIVLAILFAIGGRFLLTLPFTLASLALLKLKGLSIFQLISLYRLIQTLRRSGRFSFNQSNLNNSSSISVTEAYKILNLDVNKKITKEDVNKAYVKIQKKIHPDISPETARLSSIVNEAKDIVLNDISYSIFSRGMMFNSFLTIWNYREHFSIIISVNNWSINHQSYRFSPQCRR